MTEQALAGHRRHGDALPGEPVPVVESKVFGEDCSIEGVPVTGYTVVDSGEMAFGDGGYGGWSRPEGTVVLGGGFEATDPVAVSAPGTPGSVWPHYTFAPRSPAGSWRTT